LFGVELGTYELYLPDDQTLAAIAAPVRLLATPDVPTQTQTASLSRRYSSESLE
jgi:hypothetical protein